MSETKSIAEIVRQHFLDAELERIQIYRDWSLDRGDRDTRVNVVSYLVHNGIDWYLSFKNNAWGGAGFVLTVNKSGNATETQIFHLLNPENLPKFIKTAKYFASLH